MKTFQKTPAITELEEKRWRVQIELQDIDDKIGAFYSHWADKTPRVSKIQAEALNLIDGVDVAHADDGEEQKAIAELYHRQQVLREALREIDRRIEPLRIEHEKAVCLEVRPEYLKIGTRVVAAIKETCDASEAEKKFYEDLRDSGVDAIASYLPRIVFHGDWKWDDPNGGVIHYWRKYITENYPELKGGAR